MNPVFENYEIPWMDDELSILRDAAQKFFSPQMQPHLDEWEENGIVPLDAVHAEVALIGVGVVRHDTRERDESPGIVWPALLDGEIEEGFELKIEG